MDEFMPRKIAVLIIVTALLSGCASGPPEAPYPAFIQVDELEDVFMATMPGIRAKQLAGDPQTRRTSNRINLPPDWNGTSGGMPGRSMELFVLAGQLKLADIELNPGGYAFLPAGSLGFNMTTQDGAQILYFVNDVEPEAVIRAPIIINADLLEWQATALDGVSIKELRSDPGSGSSTWLMRIAAGTSVPWQMSSSTREGYLVSGDYQHSECVFGEVLTGQYSAGGYFYRPAEAVNGGPLSGGPTEAVWFLREATAGQITIVADCIP